MKMKSKSISRFHPKIIKLWLKATMLDKVLKVIVKSIPIRETLIVKEVRKI